MALDGFTKGMVYINGFHLGRYWSCGPQRTLYLPGALLHTDRRNEVVVLELEDCHRLDYALDLAQNLHCYHFMPRDMDLADYGKELAKRDGIYPKDELLASCFDAEGYANQRMKRMGLSAAEHGFVSWNGTEQVYEYSQPEMEPTMSM